MEQTGLSMLLAAAFLAAAPAFGNGEASMNGGGPAGIFVKDQLAPGLELPGIDGRSTVSLAGLAGRKVILLQFASW